MPQIGWLYIIIWLLIGIVLPMLFHSKPKILKVLLFLTTWSGSGCMILCAIIPSVWAGVVGLLLSLTSIVIIEVLLDCESVDDTDDDLDEDHYD